MQIYMLEIKNSGDIFPNQLLEYVSETRREKIRRYRFKEDQLLSLYGALIVRMGVSEAADIDNNLLSFNTEKNGKPYLENNKNIHFNLSHTKNYILCGISFNNQIGVDVERVANSVPYDIVKRCFHTNEVYHLNQLTGEEKADFFYQVWTKKEAYIKFYGLGLSMDLQKIDTLQQNEEQFYLTWKENEYICSIYSKAAFNPDFIHLTESDIYHYFIQT